MHVNKILTALVMILPLCKDSCSQEIDFVHDIRPLLSDACYTCHGPDAEARSTELRLDRRESALHSKVLSSGEMLQRLRSTDPEERMPPPDSNRELSSDDRAKLIAWLEAGAPWPKDYRHWSFVPPERPSVPTVRQS